MSDSGKAVAEEYRRILRDVDARPVNDSQTSQSGGIDKQVKEQVRADVDRLIEKHDPKTGLSDELPPHTPMIDKGMDRLLVTSGAGHIHAPPASWRPSSTVGPLQSFPG